MTNYIGPLTKTIIENISIELKKKENRDNIMNNIIDPLISDLTVRYYPYFITIIIILILIIILLVSIVIFNINQNK